MMRIAWILAALPLAAAEWSEPAHVLHELKPVVTYRARMAGDYLVIQVDLEPGWKTFTIDNERRAAEKLAGKPSIGIDQPTTIKVEGGAGIIGPWLQLPPKDFSKPQMRWYTFGYEKQAVFAAKVQRTGGSPVRVGIRGQACTDTTCKNVDLELSLSSAPVGRAPDLSALVSVQ
jgi:hypothetical protein